MKLLQQIWMILTLDCEGSALLTSDGMDRPLNWAERIAVKLHRMICSKSRRLNRQLIQLNEAISNASKKPETFQLTALSSSARERIRSRLSEIQK